jgi:hypothetical protein
MIMALELGCPICGGEKKMDWSKTLAKIDLEYTGSRKLKHVVSLLYCPVPTSKG